MSGANAQPWEFNVVRDPALRSEIVEAREESHLVNAAIEQTRLEEFRLRGKSQATSQNVGFKNAPVFIVVIGDKRTHLCSVYSTPFLPGDCGAGTTYLKNMANAAHNMHLAAKAQSLGSMWVSIGKLWDEPIRRILNIPEIYDIPCMVCVGHPAEIRSNGVRRDLKDLVNWDSYDMSHYRSGKDVNDCLMNQRQHTRSAYVTKP